VANHPGTKVIDLDLDLVKHPPSHLGVDPRRLFRAAGVA
jgi:hypothetical protein